MLETDVEKKVFAFKINLLQQLLCQNQSFDVKVFCSLMSVCFKQILGNDNIVQDFEINITRLTGINCRTIKEMIEFLEHNDSVISTQHMDLEKILIILQETQVAMATKQDNDLSNHSTIGTDGLKTKQFLEQILIGCLAGIEECVQNVDTKNDKSNDKQLSIDDVVKSTVIKLSPTTGLLYLNNNPYQFFAEKILSLSKVEGLENTVNAKLYGTIVHKLFERFAIECKNIRMEVLSNIDGMRKIFFQIFDKLLLETNINYDVFIQEKINKLFDIAYKLEHTAAKHGRLVLTEAEFSTNIKDVIISAKADRVEIDYRTKEVYIYDFKTGVLPNNNDEKTGVKAQLTIIGYLIIRHPKYMDYKISLLRYVDLSGKGVLYGKADINIEEINLVGSKITKMIDKYFSNCVPIADSMCYIRDCNKRMLDHEHDLAYFAREEFLV